jgi:hypothetical protein
MKQMLHRIVLCPLLCLSGLCVSQSTTAGDIRGSLAGRIPPFVRGPENFVLEIGVAVFCGLNAGGTPPQSEMATRSEG